jgi:hypothetical protein
MRSVRSFDARNPILRVWENVDDPMSTSKRKTQGTKSIRMDDPMSTSKRKTQGTKSIRWVETISEMEERSSKRAKLASKPHVCDFLGCDYRSAYKDSLKRHRNAVHLKQRPHICSVDGCNARFAEKGNLLVHRRIHTGSQPFKCDYKDCGKACSQFSDLKRHINAVHLELKPNPCSFVGCGMMFSGRGDLKRHINAVHFKHKPHICSFVGCEIAFSHRGNLKSHFKSQHTPEGQACHKKQETRIAKVLTRNGYDYKREHHISFSCFSQESTSKFARIDFVLQLSGSIVFLEVDEHQHRYGYDPSCDMRRMAHVMQALALDGNTLPVVFLRYNPQAFKVDGETCRTLRVDREARLLRWLADHRPDPSRPLTIVYMYYDTLTSDEGNVAEVSLDADYNPTMRHCITDVVV